MAKKRSTKSRNKSARSILLILCVAVGLLAFFLFSRYTKQQEYLKTTVVGPDGFITAKDRYTNTTQGFTMKLPPGWYVCETVFTNITVGKNENCDQYSSETYSPSFTMDHTSYTAIPYTKREKGESFLSWVKRAEEEFNSIGNEGGNMVVNQKFFDKSNDGRAEALVKKSHTEKDAKGPFFFSNNYFLELSDSSALVMYADIDSPQSVIEESLRNDTIDTIPFAELAAGIEPFPISTGDIAGDVGYVFNNEDGSGSAVYENYQGQILKKDKKTVAAKIRTNAESIGYKVRLPAGTYYFIYPDGKEKELIVKKGQITVFDIEIQVTDKEEIKRIWPDQ